jgi:hypothetical protein
LTVRDGQNNQTVIRVFLLYAMFIEQTKENEENKAHGRFTDKNDTRSAHDTKYCVLEAVILYIQRAVLTRRKRSCRERVITAPCVPI